MASLLSLPLELRQQVYKNLLDLNLTDNVVRKRILSSPKHLSIMYTNRQIYQEASEYFCSQNPFVQLEASIPDILSGLDADYGVAVYYNSGRTRMPARLLGPALYVRYTVVQGDPNISVAARPERPTVILCLADIPILVRQLAVSMRPRITVQQISITIKHEGLSPAKLTTLLRPWEASRHIHKCHFPIKISPYSAFAVSIMQREFRLEDLMENIRGLHGNRIDVQVGRKQGFMIAIGVHAVFTCVANTWDRYGNALTDNLSYEHEETILKIFDDTIQHHLRSIEEDIPALTYVRQFPKSWNSLRAAQNHENLKHFLDVTRPFYYREDIIKAMTALALRKNSCLQRVAWATALLRFGHYDLPGFLENREAPKWQSAAISDLRSKISDNEIRAYARKSGWIQK